MLLFPILNINSFIKLIILPSPPKALINVFDKGFPGICLSYLKIS